MEWVTYDGEAGSLPEDDRWVVFESSYLGREVFDCFKSFRGVARFILACGDRWAYLPVPEQSR